jgi:hypothetical protein
LPRAIVPPRLSATVASQHVELTEPSLPSLSEPPTLPPALGTSAELERSTRPASNVQRRLERWRGEVASALKRAGISNETILQGSLAKGTQVAPGKDIDMVAVLTRDAAAHVATPQAALDTVAQGLQRELGDRIRIVEGEDAPAKAVRFHFDGDSVRHVDVVPAKRVPFGFGVVEIPNRRTGCWESTNPRIVTELVKAHDRATAGQFSECVRWLKLFAAKTPELEGVTGLLLESVAMRVTTEGMSKEDALATVLSSTACAMRASIKDPTGAEVLTGDWTRARRERYAAIFQQAAQQAHKAIDLTASGQSDEAAQIWASLLGRV